MKVIIYFRITLHDETSPRTAASIYFEVKNSPNFSIGDTFVLPIINEYGGKNEKPCVRERHWQGQDLIVSCYARSSLISSLTRHPDARKSVNDKNIFYLPVQDFSSLSFSPPILEEEK